MSQVSAGDRRWAMTLILSRGRESTAGDAEERRGRRNEDEPITRTEPSAIGLCVPLRPLRLIFPRSTTTSRDTSNALRISRTAPL